MICRANVAEILRCNRVLFSFSGFFVLFENPKQKKGKEKKRREEKRREEKEEGG
eukprot:COSAG01_NODE_46166_length_402_cov_1.676568_1_plen_53_part_01